MQVAVKKLAGKEKAGISFISEIYAEVFYTVDEALKVILPEAQNIKEETKMLNEEQKKSIAKIAEIQFDPQLDKEYSFILVRPMDRLSVMRLKIP